MHFKASHVGDLAAPAAASSSTPAKVPTLNPAAPSAQKTKGVIALFVMGVAIGVSGALIFSGPRDVWH